MTMGFKYQMIVAPCARNLIDITINHIDTIAKIIESEKAIVSTIMACKQRLIKLYSEFNDGDFYELKTVICRFFQGRRVKVSLFLQDHIQNLDGSIILDVTGQLPKGYDVPGQVKYFENGKETSNEKINIINAEKVKPFSKLVVDLGLNLYSKERKPVESQHHHHKPEEPTEEVAPVNVSGKTEMNLLADLIGQTDKVGEKLHIDLFGAKDPYGSKGSSDRSADIIVIDTAGDRNTAFKNLESLYGMNIQETYDEKVDDSDDLLALMDAAK